MSFQNFIESGDVKKSLQNKDLAKNLAQLAKLRLVKLLVANLGEENAFEVIERCYNVLKELADALMAVKGYKSYSHEATIEFLREFYLKELSLASITQVDKYRVFRNDIFYRGRTATRQDAELAIKDVQSISAKLLGLLTKEGVA
jgi:uncharacterized protein (UPF0332 family)